MGDGEIAALRLVRTKLGCEARFGQPCACKHDETARFLIQSMDDSKRRAHAPAFPRAVVGEPQAYSLVERAFLAVLVRNRRDPHRLVDDDQVRIDEDDGLIREQLGANAGRVHRQHDFRARLDPKEGLYSRRSVYRDLAATDSSPGIVPRDREERSNDGVQGLSSKLRGDQEGHAGRLGGDAARGHRHRL